MKLACLLASYLALCLATEIKICIASRIWRSFTLLILRQYFQPHTGMGQCSTQSMLTWHILVMFFLHCFSCHELSQMSNMRLSADRDFHTKKISTWPTQVLQRHAVHETRAPPCNGKQWKVSAPSQHFCGSYIQCLRSIGMLCGTACHSGVDENAARSWDDSPHRSLIDKYVTHSLPCITDDSIRCHCAASQFQQ